MRAWAERFGLLVALAAAVVARALPFAFGVEHYGDAVVRIELAERWARAPHLWRGFAESYQFGPAHLSLLGGAIRLSGDRVFGPRALSLACGLAGVALLWSLARRAVGPAAAFWAALGLALCPLHIQASTTGASEAVFLALLLGAVELIQRGRSLWPAALLALATLVRYDGVLYIGLLGLYLLDEARTGRRRRWEPFAFGLLASGPLLIWFAINRAAVGDALAPIHFIDADHLGLAKIGLRAYGPVGYRIYCLFYWPAALLLMCTPVLGACALVGSFRALRHRTPGWELALLAWLPVAYFTVRGAVFANFRPLARFTLVAAVLSLPAAGAVLERLRGAWGTWVRAAAVASAVAMPLVLGLLCYGRNGTAAEWARPLSPISSMPPGVAEAADWLRAHTGPEDIVLLDGVWDYLDIPLAFAAGLPDERWIRVSWTDDFEQRWARRKPTVAVLIYQGNLQYAQDGQGAVDGAPAFQYRGLRFCRAAAFQYASTYRRCDAAPETRAP